MQQPKTFKTMLATLVFIAENGRDYKGGKKLTDNEYYRIGETIAEIQNWLGENRDILDKFNLEYHSH